MDRAVSSLVLECHIHSAIFRMCPVELGELNCNLPDRAPRPRLVVIDDLPKGEEFGDRRNQGTRVLSHARHAPRPEFGNHEFRAREGRTAALEDSGLSALRVYL